MRRFLGSGLAVSLEKAAFEIKESEIAGQGVFATSRIEKNQKIGLALTKISDTDNPDTDFKRTDLCAKTNHSSFPNVEIRKDGKRYYFYAKKTIAEGVELTVNYKDFDFDGERDFV